MIIVVRVIVTLEVTLAWGVFRTSTAITPIFLCACFLLFPPSASNVCMMDTAKMVRSITLRLFVILPKPFVLSAHRVQTVGLETQTNPFVMLMATVAPVLQISFVLAISSHTKHVILGQELVYKIPMQRVFMSLPLC